MLEGFSTVHIVFLLTTGLVGAIFWEDSELASSLVKIFDERIIAKSLIHRY
jgi:hypothetical protein